MRNEVLKSMLRNGAVASIYFLLTYLLSGISYLGIQFRIAEILILLCFFRRDYTIGLTIGCIIANLISPLGLWDVLFGSIATLLSCLCISFCRQLFIATLFPIIFNGFVVGAELYFLLEEPFWISVGYVALGEAVVISIVGYIIFMIVGKRESFQRLIGATHNFNFKW